MTNQHYPRMAPWVRIVREKELVSNDPPTVTGPASVYAILKPRADEQEVECFWMLVLDAQNRVRLAQEVTRGILNCSLVHPREVFRLAIAFNAASIIVAHNHPSGDPTPSGDDRAVTKQLQAAGQLLNIPLHDHLIIGDDSFYSFAEAGLI